MANVFDSEARDIRHAIDGGPRLNPTNSVMMIFQDGQILKCLAEVEKSTSDLGTIWRVMSNLASDVISTFVFHNPAVEQSGSNFVIRAKAAPTYL